MKFLSEHYKPGNCKQKSWDQQGKIGVVQKALLFICSTVMHSHMYGE